MVHRLPDGLELVGRGGRQVKAHGQGFIPASAPTMPVSFGLTPNTYLESAIMQHDPR